MDFIGRIAIPTPTASGLTFPLTSDYPYSTTQPFSTVTHRFGSGATLDSQTYATGLGPQKFTFRRQTLSYRDRLALTQFYESMQGSFQSFTYNAPQADRTTTPIEVIFESQPLSISELVNACQTGITFVENPTTAPVYPINDTCLRFPTDALNTALNSQVQQIIPLIHIRVRETAVNEIYLSDRRCKVGDNVYLPRVLDIGDKGTGVIMSQTLGGVARGAQDSSGADNIQFTLGNADRVMTKLMNDTDLKWATVEFSAYHVNSGILINLWKGFIINCASDGSARFPVMCSDGLYQASQLYPPRTASRTCWKPFNDAVNCPYATEGNGGGDGASCDHTWDGPNGCLAHGMNLFFGGIQLNPQQVLIKDNTTGVAGLGRNLVSATSIVSDTLVGQALPEIWCNQNLDLPAGETPGLQAFVTNCLVAEVRDEGDFFDCLGVVGAGPLGAYTIAPTFGGELATNADGLQVLIAPQADGFTCQGFKLNNTSTAPSTNKDLGLRQVLGFDPIQNLTGTYTNPSYQQFDLTATTATPPPVPLAAGVAFIEVRYAKPSGIAPSTPDQHSMSVPIAQGLTGITFDSGGSQTLVPGLTNPFWIAVTSYLRSIGMDKADPVTQQDFFVLESLVNPDGVSGCAQIADLKVAPLFGSAATETQFAFQGILAQQKPFRQWLNEIVQSALGYYCFEFGRLKLGIRENASDVNAFTLGNMLFQSLKLSPIEATFEHLIADFADIEYQWQANTAEYNDFDHAAYFNRPSSPLSNRIHLLGASTVSQASRIIATITREELGGINAAEWLAARNASWSTTLLALATEPGQVVSITHPDVPNGLGKFRIQSWKLMQDWSIQITAKTVTDSMYTLDIGPKPADVLAAPLRVLFYPQPQQQWAPYEILAASNDALFPNEWTFAASQNYTTLADGSALATVTAQGVLPANQFIPGMAPPTISGASQSNGGGTIAGGQTLRVAICGRDVNGICTPPSDILLVPVPAGTNTNSFSFKVLWPPAATGVVVDYVVFVSQYDDLICAQGTSGAGPTGTGMPSTVSYGGPFQRSTWALPDPNITNIRLKGALLYHGGVLGAAVTSLSGTTLVSDECIDVSNTDDWTGRKLHIIGRQADQATATATIDEAGEVTNIAIDTVGIGYTTTPTVTITGGGGSGATATATLTGNIVSLITVTSGGSAYTSPPTVTIDPAGDGTAPFVAYNITAFDALTGTFTLDRSTFESGHPERTVNVGDAFVVTFQGYDNSLTPTVFTDLGISNSLNVDQVTGASSPHSGLTTDFEKGYILQVYAGTNRGATAKVIANDATSYTLDKPLVIDDTSIVIVRAPGWVDISNSSTIQNSNPLLSAGITLDTNNFLRVSTIVCGVTVDENGVESSEADAPMRMVYIFGVLLKNNSQATMNFIFGLNSQNGPADVVTGMGTNSAIQKNPGVLTSWDAVAQVACLGADTQFDLKRTPTGGVASSVMSTPITIPAGSTSLVSGVGFNGLITVAPGDVFTAVCTQMGTSTAAASVTINVYVATYLP